MIHCKRCQRYVYLSMITCLIAGLSVFFVVKVTDIADKEENNIPMYIVGVVFWLGLLLTYVFVGMATYHRKKALELGYGSDIPNGIGVFRFFRNMEAKLADIVMIGSILLIVIELAAEINNSFMVLISIFLAIFSVHMHGILNGKNYYYLKENKNKYEKE